MTLLYYDPAFLEHHTSAGHPERVERVRAAWARLEKSGLSTECQTARPSPIDRAAIARVHSAGMIDLAEHTCREGGGMLDGDTTVSPGSYRAALLAAGAAVDAVDAVIQGKHSNAFCLIRPPGHHATPTRSMGFCLFNSVALAARRAIDHHQITRVLIVDWDVHHGNGTQDVFYADPEVMFFSVHRYPFYPGTGAADETGEGAGKGFTINLPIAFGTKRETFRRDFAARLSEAADKIKPEIVLLSAGFDAHKLDPIGSLGLETEDFDDLGKLVLDVAKTHAKGRLVSLLEGGYNIDVLCDCVEAHVEQLLSTPK